MRLFNLPVRFLIRQSRWVARGAGIAVSGAVFEILRRRDVLELPGMNEPYEIDSFTPYWIAGVAYVVAVGMIKRIFGVLFREAGQHIQRVSRDDWFRP